MNKLQTTNLQASSGTFFGIKAVRFKTAKLKIFFRIYIYSQNKTSCKYWTEVLE